MHENKHSANIDITYFVSQIKIEPFVCSWERYIPAFQNPATTLNGVIAFIQASLNTEQKLYT